MEGASDHALLKTRPDNEPKVGDVVFGVLQPTKSGKATWLKKKKRDDYPQQSSGAVASSSSPAGQAQQLQSGNWPLCTAEFPENAACKVPVESLPGLGLVLFA